MTGSNSELPRERGDKGAERTFGVMGMYADLTAVMVSWVITCVKAHQTAHLKNVQFTVYQLYLNKTFFFKCYSFRTRGIGFTHLTQATRRVGNYVRQWLWHTGQGSAAQEGNLREGTKAVGPGLRQVTGWKASRPQHRPTEAGRSPWSLWGEKAESAVQRGKWLELMGERRREGRGAGTCRGFLPRLRLSSAPGHAGEERQRSTGRRRVEQPLELTQGWEELTFPPACKDEPPHHGLSSRVLGSGQPPYWGQMSLRLKAILD